MAPHNYYQLTLMPQCIAITASGKQCGKRANLGSTVCKWHGGNAPQVKAKAEDRLKTLGLMALGVMEELANLKAEPQVRFQAAKDLLNRARVGEGDALRVEEGLAAIAEGELERRLIELGAAAWKRGERPPK